MVPDLNHILLKGNGIFAYPPYSKTPNGKLRLLFECNPMSLLMEQAGGASESGRGESGHGRVLNEKITEIHQRTPIYIGSKADVAHAVKMLRG
jgi:fructose-1,6-bisphosphatase I